MNIRLIKTNRNIIRVFPTGDRIIELSTKKVGDSVFYALLLFDPKKNTVSEIASSVHQDRWIPVHNCIWGSRDHYHAILTNENGKDSISLYRYMTQDGSLREIYSFSGNGGSWTDNTKIRIFVITEEQIIIQTEHKRDKDTEKLMGNIEFFLVLCNVVTGERVEVMDLNLINNGINTIIPVSPTHIMLKTGFSSLEDIRIDNESESDALIESVYFGSLSMFISSFRDNTTIGYKLLGTAYFDKGIVSPGVGGDYIYYTVIDYAKRVSETVFYNHVNDETLRCLREDVDMYDINNAYVIDNTPYMRNSSPETTVFFNVRSGENEAVFYNEQFAAVVGKLLVFTSVRRNRRSTRIYRNQGSVHLFEEHGRFLSGCCINDDHYIYIFSK